LEIGKGKMEIGNWGKREEEDEKRRRRDHRGVRRIQIPHPERRRVRHPKGKLRTARVAEILRFAQDDKFEWVPAVVVIWVGRV
jgi:hypothetical protein